MQYLQYGVLPVCNTTALLKKPGEALAAGFYSNLCFSAILIPLTYSAKGP